MKVETVELHGLNLAEAIAKTQKNIDWTVNHGVSVLVLNHGKGQHSDRGFSVLKAEVRKMLKENTELKEAGYRIIYGESKLPIALTYNEGQTLIVEKGLETEYVGGNVQREKNKQIYSDEAKKERKSQKRQNAVKRKRS